MPETSASTYTPPVYETPIMDGLKGLESCQRVQAEIEQLKQALVDLDAENAATLEKIATAKRVVSSLDLEVLLGKDDGTLRQRQTKAAGELIGLREFHADFLDRRQAIVAAIEQREADLPRQKARERAAAMAAAKEVIEPTLAEYGEALLEAAVKYAARFCIVNGMSPGNVDPDRLLSRLGIERGVRQRVWNEIVRLTGVTPL